MEPKLRIYRDGTLDRWATYKPLIIPALNDFRERALITIDDLPVRLGGISRAIGDHIYKQANQWYNRLEQQA